MQKRLIFNKIEFAQLLITKKADCNKPAIFEKKILFFYLSFQQII